MSARIFFLSVNTPLSELSRPNAISHALGLSFAWLLIPAVLETMSLGRLLADVKHFL